MQRSTERARHRDLEEGTASPIRPSVLGTAVLGTALAYMSDDMLNLALPSLARELAASASGVQWVLNAYYVPMVAFVLVAGALGDLLGHRRLFRIGLVVFCLGALLCATAPGILPLAAGRLLQGLAAATLLASGLALVSYAHPGAARDRALGLFFGMVAAVPALGPFLSGWLVDWLSWRWLFLAPLLLPVAALVLTRSLEETAGDRDTSVDLPGSLTLLLALVGISVGLILGPGNGLDGPVVAAFAVGAAALGWFVVVERRTRHPLLPLSLFRRRAFLGGNVVWLLAAMTSWGAVFFLAVTLQMTLGLRPLTAGLLLTPIYVVMMIGSPVAGAVTARLGARTMVVGGLTVYAVGLWLLAGVDAATSVPWGVLAPLLVFAAGMAVFTAPLAAVALGALEERDQGLAAGVNNAMGQLAGLLAVVVLPALAGLAGAGAFDGPVVAAAFPRALHATAVIALAAIPVALWALRGAPQRQS